MPIARCGICEIAEHLRVPISANLRLRAASQSQSHLNRITSHVTLQTNKQSIHQQHCITLCETCIAICAREQKYISNISADAGHACDRLPPTLNQPSPSRSRLSIGSLAIATHPQPAVTPVTPSYPISYIPTNRSSWVPYPSPSNPSSRPLAAASSPSS